MNKQNFIFETNKLPSLGKTDNQTQPKNKNREPPKTKPNCRKTAGKKKLQKTK